MNDLPLFGLHLYLDNAESPMQFETLCSAYGRVYCFSSLAEAKIAGEVLMNPFVFVSNLNDDSRRVVSFRVIKTDGRYTTGLVYDSTIRG